MKYTKNIFVFIMAIMLLAGNFNVALAATTVGANAVTNNGAGTICPTESCQVYKPQLKSGKWAEAVRATRGWVLVKGGSPAVTYYASTSGGYTISQWGWSGIKDASGDWPGSAYEKISGSPWFYKGWYKSRSGASCGRGNHNPVWKELLQRCYSHWWRCHRYLPIQWNIRDR